MKKPMKPILFIFSMSISNYIKVLLLHSVKNTMTFKKCYEIWRWCLYLLFGKLPEQDTDENEENLNEIFEPNDSLRDDFSIVRIIEQDEKEE